MSRGFSKIFCKIARISLSPSKKNFFPLFSCYFLTFSKTKLFFHT